MGKKYEIIPPDEFDTGGRIIKFSNGVRGYLCNRRNLSQLGTCISYWCYSDEMYFGDTNEDGATKYFSESMSMIYKTIPFATKLARFVRS